MGANATGAIDELSTTVTIPINVINANQIVINPVATIEFANGSEIRCEEEDLRRLPSLRETTTSAKIPCDGEFPEDADGATVTVVEDYK